MTANDTFPADFPHYLKNHTLIGIKGGRERDSFLNIWMVEVDGRYFSRSWNKNSSCDYEYSLWRALHSG